VPKHIEVRETLPMSAVGKILYRALRDELVPSADL
jgi:acyl-CoA synthetase (AMP-forming)/AMP-acid ligase II